MDNFRDSYFNVTWDLTKKHLRGTFWGKQYDTGRGFAVTIVEGGQVTVPSTETVRLKWEKPDGTEGYVTAVVVDGKFIIENIDQMFTVHGAVRSDLEIWRGGKVISSITFYVSVEKAVAVDAIESSSDFTALQEAIAVANDLVGIRDEIHDARQGKASLGANITEVKSQLADTANNFKSTVENESLDFGVELLDAVGWTSTGWTGDYATGFTHVVGQTTPLTKGVATVPGIFYKIELTLTPTCVADNGQSDFWISLGGNAQFETYRGYSPSKTYVFGIRAIDTSGLVITPWSGYNGTITNISVKEITGGITPTLVIKDSDNAVAFAITPDKSSKDNVFLGKNAGFRSLGGDSNVAVGVSALQNNTTGFWNQALGKNALQLNTVGSRNIAIGYTALTGNTVGDRNIAIGTFALRRNTSGRCNIGVGADSLWHTETGSHNIGIGLSAINKNVSGNNNIGLGQDVLTNVNADNNISIGEKSQFGNISGVDNIAMGTNALRGNATGEGNVAIGSGALSNNTTGIVLTRNVVIGKNAGMAMVTGANYNVAVGPNAGSAITTGSNNIFIGYIAGNNAAQKVDATNSIAIGYNCWTTANNQIVLGNSLIKEVLTSGVLKTGGYKSSDGSLGTNGSFDTASGKTVTVKNGLITSIL